MTDEKETPAMTPAQLEEVLKHALNAALNERDRIDHITHKADHDWIEVQRAREKKWNDTMELAKKSAVGFLTVGVLTLLVKGFAFIGGLVLAYLSARGGNPPTGGS